MAYLKEAIAIGTPCFTDREVANEVAIYLNDADPTPLHDPENYARALCGMMPHVTFVGDRNKFYSFAEHTMDCKAYSDVITTIGEQILSK
jgi:hypothetical protein